MVLARVELLPQISCIPRREEPSYLLIGSLVLASYWLPGVGSGGLTPWQGAAPARGAVHRLVQLRCHVCHVLVMYVMCV